MQDLELTFAPLTLDRWEDFECLFGERGAYGGCWCMWWRLKRTEFEKQAGGGNKKAMRSIVESGEIPGIIAYLDEMPVGWCSVAPRENFATLNRSPVLKAVDDLPVWSIVCFFVDKAHRSKGVMRSLIQAGIAYARDQGAQIVEAYPTLSRADVLPPVSSFMGTLEIFNQLGFVEHSRPSKSKAILRFIIHNV